MSICKQNMVLLRGYSIPLFFSSHSITSLTVTFLLLLHFFFHPFLSFLHFHALLSFHYLPFSSLFQALSLAFAFAFLQFFSFTQSIIFSFSFPSSYLTFPSVLFLSICYFHFTSLDSHGIIPSGVSVSLTTVSNQAN